MDSNYCWQDDEINSSDQDEKVETLSVQQKLSPDELVDIETKTKNSIIEQTKQFGFHFKQCELIVETAYRVADYIPEKLDNQQDDIWQNKIIPMLIDSLNQDVKFRGVTIDCFSAVRSLTLTIHNTNKILNDSKGSAVAIKIAQKNIPDALKTLDNCIDEAHKLNDSAIETFSEHITDLLKIIGPEAANFTDQIVSLVSAINKYYEKKYNLYNRVVVLEGDRDKYDHLINAIDTYIESLQIDVNNTDKLSDKMEQTKLYLLDIVKNIKDKFLVPKQESTTYNLFGLKLWEKNLIQLILLKIIILIKNRNLSIMKILFPGASAYSPLYALLKDIKTIVQSYVDFLIMSENAGEIFMACQYLMRQVEFLSNYNSLAIEIFSSSEQYNDYIKMLDTKVTAMAIKD